MASSSTSGNEVGFPRQDGRNLEAADWVLKLAGTTILEPSVFCGFFSMSLELAIDVVVFYNVKTDDPYGFGFVSSESKKTGGTFRTDVYTATRLRDALSKLAQNLSHRHTTNSSQSDAGETPKRNLVNYIQFRIPSLLLEHRFSNYFNKFPPCDFSVVTLFENRPCGFGFLEIPPGDSYVNKYKGMIEELKRIVYDGLARASRRFLDQSVSGSRMTHSAAVQQQRGERGRGSAASEEIFNRSVNTFGFQPTAGVTQYANLNTPSSAHLWSDFQITPNYVGAAEVSAQPLSGSLLGSHPNSTPWPGRHVSGQPYNVMQHHSQSFLHSQPTAGVLPHAAINRPSGAHFRSVMSSGVMGELLSDRLAGQQENQWSGSAYGGGYSYNMMQQQPEPSIHSQSTAGPIIYAAINTSSSSFGATDQVLSGRLAGGQSLSGSPFGGHPNSTQWPGSAYGSGDSYNVMQQQQPEPSIRYQSTAGPIFYAATNTTTSSSSFGPTHQLYSGSLAGGQSLSGSLSGRHPNSTRWPRSINNVTQHQAQSFHYQPTAGVIPHAAINIPSHAEFWSGMSAGVTGELLSDRLAGQQGTNQLSGGTHGGGYSYTGMQQLPEPSINSQSTDTTSSFSYGSPDQVFSGSLSGGQPAVGANRPLQNRDAVNPKWNM